MKKIIKLLLYLMLAPCLFCLAGCVDCNCGKEEDGLLEFHKRGDAVDVAEEATPDKDK